MSSTQGCKCFPFRRRRDGTSNDGPSPSPVMMSSTPSPSPSPRRRREHRDSQSTARAATNAQAGRRSGASGSNEQPSPRRETKRPSLPSSSPRELQRTSGQRSSTSKLTNSSSESRSSQVRIATIPPVPQGSQYGLKLLHDPPNEETDVDIILIHGLKGNCYKTWLEDSRQLFWPQSLLSTDFPKARILTFGYDADVAKLFGPAGQNGVRDHALNLLSDIAGFRSEPGQVKFASHVFKGR